MRFAFGEKDLKDGNYFPWEGRFLVRIKGFELKRSPAGNDVLHLSIDGLREHTGISGKEFITISQDHMWKLAGLFKACGYTDEQLKSSGGDPTQLVGKYAVLLRTDAKKVAGANGKEITRYNAKWFKPTPEEMVGLAPPPADTSVPDFDAGDESADLPF